MESDRAQRAFFHAFEFDGRCSKQIGPLLMESDGYTLVGRLIKNFLAEEMTEMGGIHCLGHDSFSHKEEGEDYPDLPVPGQHINRAEA